MKGPSTGKGWRGGSEGCSLEDCLKEAQSLGASQDDGVLVEGGEQRLALLQQDVQEKEEAHFATVASELVCS